MGFWSFLTGSKVVEQIPKVTDGIMKGIDNLFFTDSEKSETYVQISLMVLERAKLALSETSIRSITRRLLSVMIIGVFLIFLISSGIAHFFDPAAALHLFNLAKSLSNAVIAVIIFYYGSYGVGYLIDKKNGNK